ncbi:MAG: DUF192 domain-containing protein [Gammaproteobacteria bacterium]|nr:DUF192 domain-containing protein [Gammaproteobacteria bacterium]
MATATITIEGYRFRVWLATTRQEKRLGLMHIPKARLEPLASRVEPGMLFVYDRERHRSFWMRNTIAPLDIAYISAEGVILRTYTMAPMEDRSYPSVEPAQYVLEVRAGVFEALGIEAGDQVDLGATPSSS